MLLVLDVGNTNIALGVFDGSRLQASWRLSTLASRTVDEYGLLLRGLLTGNPIAPSDVAAIIVASVVPSLDAALRQALERIFGLEPLFVGPGLKTGMPVLYEPPADVGADRIVNAVAALERLGGPVIVVDFGTATTFDVVSARGEYVGGIILPGIAIAAEALFTRTARLPRVEIRPPQQLIGSTTVGSIQSGLYYGYLAMVDGLIERLLAETGPNTHLLATGGWAETLMSASRHLKEYDPHLTLEGLRLIWEKNREPNSSKKQHSAGKMALRKK